jgi:hypothetical protein
MKRKKTATATRVTAPKMIRARRSRGDIGMS